MLLYFVACALGLPVVFLKGYLPFFSSILFLSPSNPSLSDLRGGTDKPPSSYSTFQVPSNFGNLMYHLFKVDIVL